MTKHLRNKTNSRILKTLHKNPSRYFNNKHILNLYLTVLRSTRRVQWQGSGLEHEEQLITVADTLPIQYITAQR